MKSFKEILAEANLQRKIFVEPPSTKDNVIYDQITLRKDKPFVNSSEFQKRNQEYKDLNKSPLQRKDDDEGAWNFYECNRSKKSESKSNSLANQNGFTFKRYYSVAGVENPDTVRKFASYSRFTSKIGISRTSFQSRI